MSFARIRYDCSAFRQDLAQSTAGLARLAEPIAFEHVRPCTVDFGILGGNTVTRIAGDLVDLENDLRGVTRPRASSCHQALLYKPLQPGEPIVARDVYRPCIPPIDVTGLPLPTCQLIDFGERTRFPATQCR